MPNRKRSLRALFALCLLAVGMAAAQDTVRPEPRFQPLRGNLQFRQGEGSNIILSTGADGPLLVDAEYASKWEKLRVALRAAQALPARILINTHWHEDHVGGNVPLGQQGALIIAQANTALRLHSEQTVSLYGKQPALQSAGWPKIAVRDSLHIAWNGDEIDLLHVGPAHTDGDLVVFFRRQNVLATGDLFVADEYLPPYFDDLNGGSAAGMIAAADRLLALANDQTIIVPGHGKPTNRKALQQYRDGFVAVRDRIQRAISAGLSEDATVALHPAQGFAPAGRGTDRWVRILYREYHH